jgi:hypothetical protein
MRTAIKPEFIDVPLREIAEDKTETIASSHVYVPLVPPDPTAEQNLRIIESSGAFDFWNDPQEDIYSLNDGQPI